MNPSNTDPLAILDGRVLYEDNHLIIINKRPGEIVQGDQTGDVPLLEVVRDYLRVRGNKPGNVFCGLVHRIDRPVSGTVVFAKTSKALSRMNELVKKRDFHKTYWAIVEGKPAEPQAHLKHYLYRNEKLNKSIVSIAAKVGWKYSELSYETLSSSERYALLEVDLQTGRHHQIRAQLSAIGLPIKGDLKYGAKRSNEDGSISLHSRAVSFEHPVAHTQIYITAEPFNNLYYKLLNQ